MQKHEALLPNLEELGLTRYEAMSYAALLALGTGNGYGVAKRSGVPTPKVYQALASLAAKGFAESDGMERATYTPVPPEEALSRLKRRLEQRIETILPELSELAAAREELKARSVAGREAVLGSVRAMIRATRTKLLMTCWPEELEALRPEVEALPAGVEVILLSYGTCAFARARVFLHRRLDLVRKEHKARWFLGVADGREAAAALFAGRASATAIWMGSPGLARVLADHILHDVSLNVLMQMLPARTAAAAERKLTALRGLMAFGRK
ncbi:MAG: TrmB family transcriptional regulator [Kiritimatiellae bacterium]|nr:TrmB family transcriptional regulator [Kiritimatiellia bacterium]